MRLALGRSWQGSLGRSGIGLIGFALGLALLLWLPIGLLGVPIDTPDGLIHLGWAAAWAQQIRGGWLWPLWSDLNWAGAGSAALQLYGAGREKRIYAVPPHTPVKSLDFDDHPFEVETWTECCELCGSTESFLDEMIVDDTGKRLFLCSDTDWCQERRGEREGAPLEVPAK